jgi:microcystin-dependent protein
VQTGTTNITMSDWMRTVERNIGILTRQPTTTPLAGFEAVSTTVSTWDDDQACLTGSFQTTGGQVQNSPDDTVPWVGFTESSDGQNGIQHVYSYTDAGTQREYQRRFYFDTTNGVRLYEPWTPSGGSGGGGGSGGAASLDSGWHYLGQPGEPTSTAAPYDPSGRVWSSGRFRRDLAGCVFVEGLFGGVTPSQTAPVFTLPAGYRPGYIVYEPAWTSTNNIGVWRINPTGEVYYWTGPAVAATVSAAGLSWMADDAQTVTWSPPSAGFFNGWSNYGSGTAPLRYYVDNAGDVHLSGVITGGTSTQFASIPPGISPDQSQMFTVACAGTAGTAMARVDVQSNGALLVSGYTGGGTNAWLSLDGVVIASPQGEWYTPGLINSWVNFGAPWAPLGFTVNKNGICSIRGLVKSGTVTVPTALTTAGAIPFPPMYEEAFLGSASANAGARVDAYQDGSLGFVGFINAGNNGYLALRGRWFADAEGSGQVGAAGPPGPTGPTGSVGPAGATGPAGPTGAASTVPGPTGPTGATGPQGPQGPTGTTGAQGPAGQGVPTGGTAGQVLTKNTGTNYDTGWTTPAGGAAAPTGAVLMFAASTPPSGWLMCDGTAVSRTTYSALFAVIGTSYGIGDGSTTFALPNMAGKFPRGNTISSGAGADTHTHTSAAHTHAHTATHSHPVSATHSHPLSDAGQAQIAVAVAAQPAGFVRRVNSAAWTASQQIGASGGASTQAETVGVGLMGSTDAATAGTTDAVAPGTSDSTTPGATGSANNIPAYTGLAFIIKT